MSEGHILTEVQGRVGIITLNRPKALNAMTRDMRQAIYSTIKLWNEDENIGAVVITGAGRAFCSGADISVFEASIKDGKGTGEHSEIPQLWSQFVSESKPIICAINGVAVGQGLTMTLPCDVRLVAPEARLSFRFVRLGLTPEFSSTRFLPNMVGLSRAMELVLTGRFFTGKEGFDMGIMLEVTPVQELLCRAVSLAAEIAESPNWQLMQTKRLMYANCVEQDMRLVDKRESAIFSKARSTDAHKEAMVAFREKRLPQFH